MSFKENLFRLRKAKGWSQATLAEKAGVPQSQISELENGGRESTSYLPELAEALEVTPCDLDERYRVSACKKSRPLANDDDVLIGRRRLNLAIEEAIFAIFRIYEGRLPHLPETVQRLLAAEIAKAVVADPIPLAKRSAEESIRIQTELEVSKIVQRYLQGPSDVEA